MLTRPGVVQHPETAHSTPETLTPPSLSKQVSAEVRTPIPDAPEDAILLSPGEEDEGYNGDGDNIDDDDSDSDEGLTMTRRKPKPQSPIESRIDLRKIERRDTNASVGSTETAKKLVMDS
jgi:[calcium/calmodulin-dependent protein kinase] kinase